MSTTYNMYVRKASAGTGKTYTLAAHYIALLLHKESYRSILAVTFTNKATAEMKDRILDYLYSIAHYISNDSTQHFLARVREISKELTFDIHLLTDEYCQQEALRLHAELLIHYDEMRVQTIDSFLQTLLGGMIQKLDGAVGYQVELDVNRVISDAVDDLLTLGAREPAVCAQLSRYIDAQMGAEKNWDIRRGLNDIGNELFKEHLQQHNQQLVLDEHLLYSIVPALKANWRQRSAKDLTQLSNALHAHHFTENDFKDANRFCLNRLSLWQQCLDGIIDEQEQDKYFAPFTDTTLCKLQNSERFQSIYTGNDSPEDVRQQLLTLQQYAQLCRKDYLYPIYISKYINDLVLMGDLLQRIHAHLVDTNTRLLATTANTLAQALQPGDADFILEKAGIRYKHIMLDEFQDTSFLQWNNFEKLIQEVLASTAGSTLIVGDIKQSIYRWRNGNWKIMRDLPTDWPKNYNHATPQLVRNFRSHKQVVQFNLETMSTITANEPGPIAQIYQEGYDGTNLDLFYNPHNDGGFVQVRCYTQSSNAQLRKQVRSNILTDMFSTIEQLLQQGTRPSSIMILFRMNKEANEILDALHRLTTSPNHEFPLLAITPFISSSCFQLQFSPLVNLLINAIRYIYLDDLVALKYVHLFAPDFDIQSRRLELQSMALTDLTELIIQDCIILPKINVQDLSYINCFRDNLRSYIQDNGSDGVAFLRYWDDKMSTRNIPAVDVPGIRLMTIHTSKGLEAANVFLPFCDWDMESDKQGSKLWCNVPEITASNGQSAMMPIPQNASTAEAGFDTEYNEEHLLQRIDNFNLLYVAFTRAAERLFVYSDVTKNGKFKQSKKDGRSIDLKPHQQWDTGQLIAERCQLWDRLNQRFWNEQIGDPADFETFTQGDPNWVAPAKQASDSHNPMSFQSVTPIPSNCYSTSAHIEFRQSQDSRKYGWNIASTSADSLTMEQCTIGTICHDLLANIRIYPTTQQALEAVSHTVQLAFQRGIIPTTELRDHILTLLCNTVSSLSQWFTGNWHIQCEESILHRDEHGLMDERRMDRVMWSPDHSQAIVLDYKFGQDNPKYDRQVQRYMNICRRMGATSVQGYLWIAAESRLLPITYHL